MSSATNNQIASTEATQQSVRARILIEEANAANASRSSSSADSTYQREWKKFKIFVDEKRNENILPSGPWCYSTRDSADLYFATVVAKLKVHPKTASRIRPALQFYDFGQRKVWEAKEMDVEREKLGGLIVYKYILYRKGQK